MLYRSLQLNDVETQLILYRGEGHGLTEREHQLDAIKRIKAWFDLYVGSK